MIANAPRTSEVERKRFLSQMFPPLFEHKRSKHRDETSKPMNITTAMFYDALDNNNLNFAACILAQSALITRTPSRSQTISKYTGSLQETVVLKEMLLALYRKYGLDSESLHTFFLNTYHEDKRHPILFLQMLSEWGQIVSIEDILKNGPGHFRRHRLRYEQDLIMFDLTSLDNVLLSSATLSVDDLLSRYEALKPVDFISAWYRGKSLLLFGQLSLAEKVYLDYCQDQPRDPLGYQQLLRFLTHKSQIRRSVKPLYVLEANIHVEHRYTTEEAAEKLLDIDPVNAFALNAMKNSPNKLWQTFCRLWDAIQVSDLEQYWISMLEIVSTEYSKPDFLPFIQQYCQSFLEYAPIHLQIFKHILSLPDAAVVEDGKNNNWRKLGTSALLLIIVTNNNDRALKSRIKHIFHKCNGSDVIPNSVKLFANKALS